MTGAETQTTLRPTPYWRIRPQWGYDPTAPTNLSIRYYRVERIFGTWTHFEGNFDTEAKARLHCDATYFSTGEILEVRVE